MTDYEKKIMERLEQVKNQEDKDIKTLICERLKEKFLYNIPRYISPNEKSDRLADYISFFACVEHGNEVDKSLSLIIRGKKETFNSIDEVKKLADEVKVLFPSEAIGYNLIQEVKLEDAYHGQLVLVLEFYLDLNKIKGDVGVK